MKYLFFPFINSKSHDFKKHEFFTRSHDFKITRFQKHEFLQDHTISKSRIFFKITRFQNHIIYKITLFSKSRDFKITLFQKSRDFRITRFFRIPYYF